MHRYLLPILIFGVVGILSFYHLRDEARDKTGKADVHAGTTRSEIFQESENGPMGGRRTKSKNRPNHPKPTIEETSELLRSTIIPVVDFPEDQPLPERVALLNELIQQAGIEPHRLRVVLRTTDPARQWRFTDGLKARDVPMTVTLKFILGSTKLRGRVCENGVVELYSQDLQADDDLDSPSTPSEQTAPRTGETDNGDPFAPPEQSERSGE